MNKSGVTILVALVGLGVVKTASAFPCGADICNRDGQYCTNEKFPRCANCDDILQSCFTLSMPYNCTDFCLERRDEQKRESTCPPLENLTHGSHNASAKPQYQEIVTFKCQNGYHLIGPNTLICVHGKWGLNPPTCEETMCRIPEIANGTVSDYNRTSAVGSNIQYQCDNGFLAADPFAKAHCLPDGRWSLLMCVKKVDKSSQSTGVNTGLMVFSLLSFSINLILICVIIIICVRKKLKQNKLNNSRHKDPERPPANSKAGQDTDDTCLMYYEKDCDREPGKETDKNLFAKPISPRPETYQDGIPEESDSPSDPLLQDDNTFHQRNTNASEIEDSESDSDTNQEENKTETPNQPEATKPTPSSKPEQFTINIINNVNGNHNNNNNNGAMAHINVDNNQNYADISADNTGDHPTMNVNNNGHATVNVDATGKKTVRDPAVDTNVSHNNQTDNKASVSGMPQYSDMGRNEADDHPFPIQASEDDKKTSSIESVKEPIDPSGHGFHAQTCDSASNAKVALPKNTVHLSDIKRKSNQP